MHQAIRLLIALALCTATRSFGQSGRVQPASAPPIQLGITDSLASTILHETRRVNIYLPDGYSPDSARTYPVIYLLDGGIDEDFVHIAGLVRYNTTPWINRFPPSIVVGIQNVNRRRDFTFAVPNLDFVEKTGFSRSQFTAYGGSAKFMAFLEKELQPFIEKRYAANTVRTLIGESLGGLLATEILLRKPTLFNTYIILSPSLWWDNESLLRQPGWSTLGRHPLTVYVGACEKTSSVVMYKDAKALADLLGRQPAGKLRVLFDYLPTETHATLLHQGVYNAVKAIYPLTK
ncbi:alpha/beta hydrolase [Fibrella arboris]|uniref:alpha/beta hydrolase n=1 Tax=Fibrella arboris TaxID=3242486 RepID=UPI003522A45B